MTNAQQEIQAVIDDLSAKIVDLETRTAALKDLRYYARNVLSKYEPNQFVGMTAQQAIAFEDKELPSSGIYADESGYTEQDQQAASLVHDAELDPRLVDICSRTTIYKEEIKMKTNDETIEKIRAIVDTTVAVDIFDELKANMEEPDFIHHAYVYGLIRAAIQHYDEFIRNEDGYDRSQEYLEGVVGEELIKADEASESILADLVEIGVLTKDAQTGRVHPDTH